MLLVNKQVFQVDTRPAQKGRVVVEEEREADRGAEVVADDDLGVSSGAEERFTQDVLGGCYLVREFFVNGELFYEAQNQRRVALGRLPDFEIFWRHRHLIKKTSAAMVTKRITLTYAFVVKNATFNLDKSSARTSLC